MRTYLGSLAAGIMIWEYDFDVGMSLFVLQFDLKRLGAFAVVYIWLASLWLKND